MYFYQCEFPYGVDQDFAHCGFRGYLIGKEVREHEVFSAGIYSNFRNEAVHVDTAVEHPNGDRIRVMRPFTVKLDNRGGILSVVNGSGDKATEKGRPARCKTYCSTHPYL